MKQISKAITFLLVMTGVYSVHAQTPQWLWVEQAGSEGLLDIKEGKSVAVDNAGNCLVTGYFSGNTTFGNTTLSSLGNKDIFIAKYEANGNLLWVEQAGGTSDDQGMAISVDDFGNSLLTGSFRLNAIFGDTALTSKGFDDIFVAKYDANGNLLWVEQAGGTSVLDEGRDISVDASGNCLVTGWFNDVAIFGNDTLTGSGNFIDSFIAKFDASGNLLWVEQAGVTLLSKVEAWGIATDVSGNCFVTGRYHGPATFGDTTLTSDGDDIFIAKYDVNGNLVWIEQVSGTATAEVGRSIEVEVSGNILVTGDIIDSTTFGDTTLTTSAGHGDIFVAKYDENGNFIWVQQAGGEHTNEESFSIAADASGNSFITGYFEDTAKFNDTTLTSVDEWDIFVAKYDVNGIFRWVEQVSGPRYEFSYDITVDGSGNSFITGRFVDSTTFGDTTLISERSGDIFVAKIGEDVTGVRSIFSTQPSFQLQQNYPNPFNPSTTISYRLPKTAQVKLTIYNLLGQEVKTLVSAFQSAGEKSVSWDGTNTAGEQVSSGIYLYSLQTGDFTDTRKMLLVR